MIIPTEQDIDSYAWTDQERRPDLSDLLDNRDSLVVVENLIVAQSPQTAIEDALKKS